MLYRKTAAGFVALTVMIVSGCQTTEQYQASVDQGLDAPGALQRLDYGRVQ